MKFVVNIPSLLLFLLFIPFICFCESYTVSSVDINSVTCPPGTVATDIFFSEKVPLKVDNRKDKVFFEFVAEKEQIISQNGVVSEKIIYATTPVTVTLFCGDIEYNITLTPMKLSSGMSIRLEKPADGDKYIEYLEPLKREERISSIVSLLFSDGILKGFQKKSSSEYHLSKGTTFYLRNIYTGGGYVVKELYIYSPTKTVISDVDVVSASFISRPIAVSILDEEFKGWTRAIVIEAKSHE